MSSNIVGEPFKDYVADQINIRQETHGKLNRDTEELFYLNSRTSWIKLGSGTYISQSRLEYIEGIDENYPEGKFLPVSYVLFSGTTALDYKTGTSTKSQPNITQYNKEGIRILNSPGDLTTNTEEFGNFNPASGIIGNTQTGLPAYGYSGDTSFGLVPMPGIESVSVKSMDMGSIKKASIKLKVHNKTQFDIIDTLYMRLGYTMLLEWGDSHYLDPNDPGKKVQPMGNTLLNGEFYKGKNDGIAHLDFLKIIENTRKKYCGSYDGLLAKVVNFKWTFNPDGSYSINLDVISLGDVVESLKMDLVNYETTNTNSTNSKKEEENDELDIIDSNRNKHKIGTILYNIRLANTVVEGLKGESVKFRGMEIGYVQKPIPKDTSVSDGLEGFYSDFRKQKNSKLTPTGELAPNGFWGNLFGVEDNYTKLKNEFYGKVGSINFDSKEKFNNEEDLNYVFLTQVQEKEYNNFIRLGHLLDLIQAFLIPYDKKSLNPLILLDTNINKNLMFYIPNMVSIDPKVCIIRNDEFYITEDNSEKIYEGLAPFKFSPPKENSLNGNNDYGKVMNIYINFSEVLSLLEGVDKEGRISLMALLKNLCRRINKALGGVNRLTPKIYEEENTLRLVDETPLPDKKALHELFNEKAAKKYVFDLFSYDTKLNDKSVSTSNFAHNVGITTTVTPEYATMITIGSTANGFVVGEDATFFSKWNDGIIDRFKEELVVGNEAFNKNPDKKLDRYRQVWKNYYKLLKTGQIHGLINKEDNKPTMDFGNMGSLAAKGSVAIAKSGNITGISGDSQLTSTISNFNVDDEIISANYQKVPAFYNLLNYYSSQDSKKDNSSPGDIGFLPFHLNLDLDGISGTKIYNKISINSKFLPTNYSTKQGDRLEFVLTNVDHELSKNTWVTKLNSIATVGDKYLLETIDLRQTLLDRFFGGLSDDFNNFYSYNQNLFGPNVSSYNYQRPSTAESGNKVQQSKIFWYDNSRLFKDKKQRSDNVKNLIKVMELAGVTNPITQLGMLCTIGKESKFIPQQEKMFGKNQIDDAIRTFTKRFNNTLGKGNWDRQTVIDLLSDRSPAGYENWFNVIYGYSRHPYGGKTYEKEDVWHKVGDGKGHKYRGRGMNQITWNYNYASLDEKAKGVFGSRYKGNIIDNPDELINDMEVSSMIAVTFFVNGYKRLSKKYKQFPKDINKFTDLDQSILAFVSINGGGKLKSFNDGSIINANGIRGYLFIDGYLDTPGSNKLSEPVVLNPIVQDNQEVKTVEIEDDSFSQPPPPSGNKITFELSQPSNNNVDWDSAHGVSSKRIPNNFIKKCEEASKNDKIKIIDFTMNIVYNPSTKTIDSKFEATWVPPQGNEKPDTVFASRGSIGDDYQNRFKDQVITPNKTGKNLHERLMSTYPNFNFKDWLFENQEIKYPGGSIFYSQIFIVGSSN